MKVLKKDGSAWMFYNAENDLTGLLKSQSYAFLKQLIIIFYSPHFLVKKGFCFLTVFNILGLKRNLKSLKEDFSATCYIKFGVFDCVTPLCLPPLPPSPPPAKLFEAAL